ncbi:DUF2927 domain-containing protein [Aliiroseovarius sp. F20344]|uniref:DUF2927 domain-containing protein n=1 Tax=Aliiroseovarius sp. F20344 TaxID=2926414 RepID=UPI001FF2542D|nr:DUF2927 domain-containing protein [Aliiroseovarius sp. F20344]MCK0143544.1 DUF2927 domain-containing protein [Aliiroseovarius sp. F20344]
MRSQFSVSLITLALLGLSGCVAPMSKDKGFDPQQAVQRGSGGGAVVAQTIRLPSQLPPMKAFSQTRTSAPVRANSLIMGDFLDLSFELESGRTLPVLSRFETPITVAVKGQAPQHMQADLEHLLGRLRREAGINIKRGRASASGLITIEMIPKRKLQKHVPHAACFVAPNVSGWGEYLRARGTAQTDWTKLRQRTKMSVFLPSDVSPQEMRDCLHEEIAQAIGPVNDLYRLENSVFNDDNFHTVLTGFDMLILRAYYAPELQSGMSRAEVAQRLPAVLERINPAGGTGSPRITPGSPTAWKQAIVDALGRHKPKQSRQAAAQRAVSIARQRGWQDTRLAFSLFAQGRLSMQTDSQAAFAAFREAEAIYLSRSGTELHAAHMGVQLSAYALSAGHADQAVETINRHLPAVKQAQNAALLATLLMIKAEALEHMGRIDEAQRVRLDSLGWARYGFGSNAQVGARLQEIAAIAPG